MENETRLPAGRQGFTIIEVLVVLTIFITLMAIGYVSVVGIERRAPITATVNTLIADLRSQQTQAMSGGSQGTGVSIQSISYTFIPSGRVTSLPENITLSPAGTILYFANGSGDTAGATLTVTQTLTGEHKTVTINRYGAVTSIE